MNKQLFDKYFFENNWQVKEKFLRPIDLMNLGFTYSSNERERWLMFYNEGEIFYLYNNNRNILLKSSGC